MSEPTDTLEERARAHDLRRERDDARYVGTVRYAGAKCVPPSMRETVPLEDVVQWGKGRCHGDKAGWLVGKLASGRILWGRVSWQLDPISPILLAVSRHSTPRAPGVEWIDRPPEQGQASASDPERPDGGCT